MVAVKISWEEELSVEKSTIVPARERASREKAVVSSALWAAAGDALGWMTELARGEAGVAHRTGSNTVSVPVRWQRIVGGQAGPRVNLPAGTYSDDTQLRLAVSRAIRGDGEFDVEAFAKIEVTVWPSYALGAGLGTKAAASNLARRGVNWFSNFFDSGGQKYVAGGGNGAAMRIQPHVWAAAAGSMNGMIANVLRDSLVTHGHPHGFCGAVFHAMCVAHALENRSVPEPSDWLHFIEGLSLVPKLIADDPQLAAFWQSAWETNAGLTIESAIRATQSEASGDVVRVRDILDGDPVKSYRAVLERIGCLEPHFRGSGLKTALAAAALAWLYRDRPIGEALALSANELESDTDTIATMAGAVLGCVHVSEPEWAIQDRDYITQEAMRLAAIADGRPQDSFAYPDLGRWTPPNRQTASVGLNGRGYALAGLGTLDPISPEYAAGDAIWQWFMLPFGQTILAKRRAVVKDNLSGSQLPGERQAPIPFRKAVSSSKESQATLFDPGRKDAREPQRSSEALGHPPRSGLDYWTDVVINRDFDDLTIGRVFNRLLEETGSADTAVAFAAIIAKAKLARERRRRG
ncbi:ADP-ribosylglycohydrolase family protein [Lichenibacterium minor]|uniref:ADP-ribosylglycohydrolase family protein n=1 Tax=Lichenibacterium minor TaxID=2316528 RepID=A0A4Q2TXI5_9HYPH|nr:ADP-ribosylglycohydrolase family protein [Lichenibacterium minor]RYC28819.1 ADP-ribosylglycohydrolase family protein [Lichenibacterium minor]